MAAILMSSNASMVANDTMPMDEPKTENVFKSIVKKLSPTSVRSFVSDNKLYVGAALAVVFGLYASSKCPKIRKMIGMDDEETRTKSIPNPEVINPDRA